MRVCISVHDGSWSDCVLMVEGDGDSQETLTGVQKETGGRNVEMRTNNDARPASFI